MKEPAIKNSEEATPKTFTDRFLYFMEKIYRLFCWLVEKIYRFSYWLIEKFHLFMENSPWLANWLFHVIGIFFPLLASIIAGKVLSTTVTIGTDDFFLYSYLLCLSIFLDYYMYRKNPGTRSQYVASVILAIFSAILMLCYITCKLSPQYKEAVQILCQPDSIKTTGEMRIVLFVLCLLLVFMLMSEYLLHGEQKEQPNALQISLGWFVGVICTILPTLVYLVVGAFLFLFHPPNMTPDLFLPTSDEVTMLTGLILLLTLSDYFRYCSKRNTYLLEYYLLLLAFAVFMMLYGIYKAKDGLNIPQVSTYVVLLIVICITYFVELSLEQGYRANKGG